MSVRSATSIIQETASSYEGRKEKVYTVQMSTKYKPKRKKVNILCITRMFLHITCTMLHSLLWHFETQLPSSMLSPIFFGLLFYFLSQSNTFFIASSKPKYFTMTDKKLYHKDPKYNFKPNTRANFLSFTH